MSNYNITSSGLANPKYNQAQLYINSNLILNHDVNLNQDMNYVD